MMKIEIKNIDLARVINFLEKEDMKGIKSINRSALTQHLGAQLEKVVAGEKTIREDFKDDHTALEKELKQYYNEKVVVDGGNFLKPLNVVKAHVKELTGEEQEREFKDDAAFALFVLYEAFNLGGNENE